MGLSRTEALSCSGYSERIPPIATLRFTIATSIQRRYDTVANMYGDDCAVATLRRGLR